MNNRTNRSQWAGCSDFNERKKKLLEAHEEFLRLIDNGFKITEVRKKRPRIHSSKTPKEVEVAFFGGKVRMTFQEYQEHGQGLKVLMEIF